MNDSSDYRRTPIRRGLRVLWGLGLGVSLLAGFNAPAVTTEHEPRVTIEADGLPLADALQQIEKSTGYKITLADPRWGSFPVSLKIENATREGAMRVLLKDFNYIVTTQDDNGANIAISSAATAGDPSQMATNVAPGIAAEDFSEDASNAAPPADLSAQVAAQPRSEERDYAEDLAVLNEIAQ